MKLWSVKFDRIDYNQYDEFIIIANNEQECIDCLEKEYDKPVYYTIENAYAKNKIGDAIGDVPWEQEIYIQEINLIADSKEPTIILGSYNAG